MTKAELRARMNAFLASLGNGDLAARSAAAQRRFMDTETWKSAQVILCYLSMPRELDTGLLVSGARQAGKLVAIPRIEGSVIRFFYLPADAKELPRDRWGIPVPDPSWEPFLPAGARRALVVTPGLAFDHGGNRLGRGKGYYDGFFRSARAAPGSDLTAIGLCFSEQLVAEVPHTERDESLQGVVTDRESVILS